MKILRTQRGVTLIEVLIALVVVSVGLLGIAKMQALAIASTRTSNVRSLIAIEAASIASAMHANQGYWQGVTLPFSASVAVNSTGTVATVTSSDSNLAGTPGTCVSTVCTAAGMAAYDLGQWGLGLAALVPSSTNSISCSGSPIACTVQISWTENTIGMNGQSAPGSSATQYYELAVQP